MEAHFTNGSTVSRAWLDQELTELVAAFQYETDALDFAKARQTLDAKHACGRADYIISNHYSGKVTILRGTKAGSP